MSHPKPLLLRNFYARRCLRIWPLYFLCVAAVLIPAAIVGNGPWAGSSARRLHASDVLAIWPWLVTFTYNYYRMFHYPDIGHWGWFGHLWTISVEEQFYLVFPFLFAFLSKRRLVAALWICIALGPTLRSLLTWWLDSLPQAGEYKWFALYQFAPAHFDAFAAGALLALMRPFLAYRLDLARVFMAVALAAAAAYTCVYLSINLSTLSFREAFSAIFLPRWRYGQWVWAYSVIIALSSALIALILAGEGWLLNACRLRLLRPIGRISYGAYVYHSPVLCLFVFLWPVSGLTYRLAEFSFCYPVTLLIAYLSFRYFEEPILSLRARFY